MKVRFRLQELLDDRDPPMSQSELARLSGISFATINNIANNRTAQVSLKTLGDLASVLRVEPGDLVVADRKPRRH
jgi:DNA-binding Xre family transcriptional regulator